MRLDVDVRIRMREERLRKAMARARTGSLSSVGYLISQIAKSKIKRSRKPGRPGQPPTTRRGLLRRAIRYQMSSDKYSVVIGPIYSMVGTSGQAHEFGGQYKGARFPERPFMGPSLDEAMPQIGPKFRGSVYD